MDADDETYMSGTGDGIHPTQAFCVCGSAWFVAQIAIEHDGTVNWYSGPFQCVGCGEEYPDGWTGAITVDGGWFDPTS